jgi:hypothetical protein
MKYLVLLYADENEFASLTPEEMQAAMAGFAAYNKELAEAGVLAHGEPILPSAKTKTLRRGPNGVHTTDGPMIETKEQLGGYYVLDVASEEEAVAWASRCPILYTGTIEVRGLVERPT